MRCYGFPEKDAWIYSPKSEGMQYRTPARRWWKRYLHKCARMLGKKEVRYAQEDQKQEKMWKAKEQDALKRFEKDKFTNGG